MTNSFRDILAWQKAHQFVLDVYTALRNFPEEERYGLSSQFKRAAISIPANIAEGYRKLGKADKLRFMNIAQGSLEECRYYILLSRDLGFIDNPVYNSLSQSLETTSKFLNFYSQGIANNAGIK